MDLLLQVNTGCISPAMLADATARHYAAHVVAYGYTLFVPKHHYTCCISHGSVLVACWVHERKHKIAKRWAVPLCMAMLEECTMAHMNSLKEPFLKPCLPQAVPACSKLRAHGFASAESALLSKKVTCMSLTIGIGNGLC